MTPRSSSFGQHGQSLVDRLIKTMRFRHIAPEIPAQSTVVDLGCGYHGELLAVLAPSLKQGFGIDMAVAPKVSVKNVRLLRGRVDQKLPIDSQTADVVTALAIIEHVECPDRLLKEAYRILKPNGTLLLTTPSRLAQPMLEFMAFRLHVISSEEIADHKRYYTKKTLRDAVKNAGFSHDTIVVQPFELGMNLLAKARK